MHPAPVVAVTRERRQHAVHRAGRARIALEVEIERPDMVLERIRRDEHGVARKVDAPGGKVGNGVGHWLL